MNDDARDIITALGAVAEMCAEFYRQLIKNGFPSGEALFLTKTYLSITLSNNKEDK